MKEKRLLFVLNCLMGLCLAATAWSVELAVLPDLKTPDFSEQASYSVVDVIDGDTIVVTVNGKETRIRLIGVDTSEVLHPSKPVQEFGREASQFTTNLLQGEQVYLLYDGQKPELDRYGRTLAYVYRAPDGLFVNAEIIRQGYGHAYVKYPFKYLEKFRQLERFAREAEKGLWKDKAGITTPKPLETKAPIVSPVVKPLPKIRTDTSDVTVYVTRTGTKYHRAGCRSLRRSQILMSLKEAKARYSPCSICKPPQ